MKYRWNKNLRTTLVLILCTFYLSGCSTKIAYHFLDWAMMWYVESYVTLNSEQKKLAGDALKDFHTWHRTTELNRYATYIEGLKVRLDKPVTPESIHAETDQAQLFLDASFNKLIPALVDLCMTLSNKQVEEIQSNLQKEQGDYEKKYLNISKEKLYKRRITDFSDYVAPFFGRFSEEQKAKLKTWSQSLTPYEELTLKQQQIWEQTFVAAMEHRSDRAKLEASLRQLMLYQTDNWQPELQARLDHNQQLTYTLIAELMNSRSEKQKEKTQQKLDGYLSDFRELAHNKQ